MLHRPYTPAIIAKSVQTLIPTIKKYSEELQRPKGKPVQTQPSPSHLISHAMSTAPSQPLSEHDANMVTCLFPSLRSLEQGTRSAHGRKILAEHLNEIKAQHMIEFWEDEWII